MTNSILRGDCIELLKNIPDDSIDISFADPPYNIKKQYNSYDDNMSHDEYLSWSKQWIQELIRVTSGSIFILHMPKWLIHYVSILSDSCSFKNWIAWDAPTAQMSSPLKNVHYGILYFIKNKEKAKEYKIRHPHRRCRKCNYILGDFGGKKDTIHPFGNVVTDIWSDIHRIRHNKYRDNHPCQLPVPLLERIILMSSNQGDTILDPFMGVGTTAIAAKQLGRKYMGIELDEDYIDIAKNKLDLVSNSKINNSWVSFHLNEPITIRDCDWEDISKSFVIPEIVKELEYKKIKYTNMYKLI